jgi:1-phosphofructokinase
VTIDVVTVALNPVVDWTIWIPDFGAGAVNRVQREQTDAGGKAVNVASFLADYGLRVAVTGLRGRDNREIFRSFFAGKGIADRFVEIAGATRIGIKILDPVKGETTDINFPGLLPATADLEGLAKVLRELAGECDWFVLSGRLPPGVSPALYGELIRLLRGAGKRAALDTSGEALRLGTVEAPVLIKPNLAELSELVGRELRSDAEILDVARGLQRQGIEYVVVSLGARGALFIGPDAVVSAVPPRVEVASTVGAGDALLAGTIAGLRRGLSLPEIARLATAFAAGALSQVTHGLPSPAVMQELAYGVLIQCM